MDSFRRAGWWRSRGAWIGSHFLCGIAAILISGSLLAAFVTGREISNALMTAAAFFALLPLILYQGFALRKAVAPAIWIAAWLVGLLSAPWIVGLVLRRTVEVWGNDTVFIAWFAGAALSGVWAAVAQWAALRGRVSLAAWLLRGGGGFALAVLAAGLGFLAGLLIWPGIWFVAVPLAFGVYGATTWRALEPLIATP